jgi:hypothetical protein
MAIINEQLIVINTIKWQRQDLNSDLLITKAHA